MLDRLVGNDHLSRITYVYPNTGSMCLFYRKELGFSIGQLIDEAAFYFIYTINLCKIKLEKNFFAGGIFVEKNLKHCILPM